MTLKLSILTSLIIAFTYCFSQTGTDIVYIKTKHLDNSYTGKTVQLDLAKKAEGNIVLQINQQPVQFVQHKAGGTPFNYWFYQQYFQSAAPVNGYNLRLVQSRVDAVTADSITVTNYFDCYTQSNALAAGKSMQQQFTLPKKLLQGILVKQQQAGM